MRHKMMIKMTSSKLISLLCPQNKEKKKLSFFLPYLKDGCQNESFPVSSACKRLRALRPAERTCLFQLISSLYQT